MKRLLLLLPLLVLGTLAACADAMDVLTSDYEYGRIEVEANRRNGEPVPGVELTLHSGGRPMGYGTTDADGRFVFEFVPQGEYGIFATPEEPFVARPTTNIRDQIVLKEGTEQSVEFTFLKRGPGAIEVVAVEAGTEAPVPGAAVTLYTFEGGLAEDTTDASGRVRFAEVPFGEYGVAIEPPRFFVVEQERGRAFVDEVIVDAGSLQEVRFTLERCEGRVRAVVRDAAGQPAPGVNAVVYTFAGVVEAGKTDAAGEHVFGPLPCGDYGVSLRPTPGYLFDDGRGTSFVDGVTVANASVTTAEFTVETCRGRLRAEVRDGSGAPVAGAGLMLYTYLGIEAEVETGADGAYVFDDVPCFTGYGISVDPPAGYAVEQGKGSSYFDGIDIGEGTEARVRFQLSRTG